MSITANRVRVVAGIIFQSDRVLACQRHESGVFPLKWEFPGGKIKSEESDFIALRRELQEELGILVSDAAPIFESEHLYPDGPDVSLHFYHVLSYEGGVQNLVFQRIEWVTLAKLEQLDFLAGDKPLIRHLMANYAGKL